MATADELLAMMAEDGTVYDDDICFADQDTRTVAIPERLKIIGVENDDDVAVRRFRVPAICCGTDLSAFEIRVNFENAKKERDFYLVTDAVVDGDCIVFSWRVDRVALRYKGRLRFAIHMELLDADGFIEKEWNSAPAHFDVLEGLEVELTPEEEETARAAATQLVLMLEKEGENQIAAVEAAGAKTIASIPEDYTALSDEIDSLYKIEKSANLFDPAALVSGYYYSNDAGNVVLKENTGYSAYKLSAEPGKSYTFTGYDHIAILSKDAKYRGTSPAGSPTTIVLAADSDVTEICLSLRTSKYPADSYMIVEGDALPEEYVPFYEKRVLAQDIDVYVPEKNIAKEVYHVGSDYEFTSFSACMKALAKNKNNKTVYVHGGVYDVFAEIGGSEFALSIPSETNWADVSVMVPPNTHIIGVGYVELQFLPTADEIGSVAATLLSPINTRGTCTIENIVIKADNCRYCIHDESSGLADFYGAKKVYKNVKCYKTRSGNVGFYQAYAAGIDNKQSTEFDSCYFEAPGIPFTIHNRATKSTTPIENSARITVKDCVFVSTADERSIKFGSAASEQQHILTWISNCYLSGKISITNEDANATTPKNPFDLTVVKCGDAIVEETATNNIYTAKVFN